jgi:tRNA (cytidine/uridine-2'-O-)-methyltransferase
MNVVLVEPEIPPNTGNVARLCAATNARLHLIEPLGFEMSDRRMQRAGMDYWKQVDWQLWPDWASFVAETGETARVWFVESGGPRSYTDVGYQTGDYLVFGRESAGLPEKMLAEAPERWLHIPMGNPDSRSLNLSNCVAIVLYEALRQVGLSEGAK